jgi:hypothetical protein
MKNIKVYESFRTEQEIKDLCSEYGIGSYQIRDDGSIDVDDDVYLVDEYELGNLTELPLTFNIVKGHFICGYNNLTTLERCPKEVRTFDCSDNKITTLRHSPKIVGEDFYCVRNLLTSLEGLENTYIAGNLFVYDCRKLYSLKGFPKKVSSFDCYNTPIYSIYETFIQECDYDTMRKFNKFDVIYTDGLDWFIDYDNLGKFLRSVGKEDLMMSKENFNDFIETTKYRWDY